MSWRRGRGLEQAEVHSWGKVFKDATKKQLNRREVDRNLIAYGGQPRTVHFSKEEIDHPDQEASTVKMQMGRHTLKERQSLLD